MSSDRLLNLRNVFFFWPLALFYQFHFFVFFTSSFNIFLVPFFSSVLQQRASLVFMFHTWFKIYKQYPKKKRFYKIVRVEVVFET